MGQWYRWVTNPQRIEFILHFQEPLMIVRPVFRPGQIEGLVGSKKGGIKTILNIHFCCFDVEMVNTRRILILIPVYEELRVALMTQLEALEPARVAIVWHQRWCILFLQFCITFSMDGCLGKRLDHVIDRNIRSAHQPHAG